MKLITFETAKLANKKGFIGWSEDRYNRSGKLKESKAWSISAPSQTDLQEWLREKHMIRVYPTHGVSGNFNFEIYIWDKPNTFGKWTRIGNISSSASYEGALEKGLFAGLELIKKV